MKIFKDILNKSDEANLSEEAEKAVIKLLKYRENVKKEIIGNTEPLSYLPEKQRTTLENMVREAYEDVKRFFNIEVNYFPEIEITEGGESYAHYDKEAKKLRIDKEIALKLLKSGPEKLKALLAEELIHAIRDQEDLSNYADVEEFFGHLAKLNEEYKVGEGQELLENYIKQRDGKWYAPEEMEKIYKELEEKIDYFTQLGNSFIELIADIEPKLDEKDRKEFREKIGNFFAKNVMEHFLNKKTLLEDNLPLSVTKGEGKPYWDMIFVGEKEKKALIKTFAESVLIGKKLTKNGEFIKSCFKEVKRIADETEPYKYSRRIFSDDYRKYESLKVHARGYSTAEKIFKYIEEEKIEASDLFYKNPRIIKMLLFDGKKTDYMKKFAWKAYAEAKNFERKLKNYFSKG